MADGLVAQVQAVGQLREQFRTAAAPGVDRLLDVADAEQRACAVGLGGDLGGHGFEHRPLGQAGVLELVEQQVGHPRVETVVHLHQLQRALLMGGRQPTREVIEQQQAMLGLQLTEACVEARHQLMHGRGLRGGAAQGFTLGVFDQWHIHGRHGRGNGLAVVGSRAGQGVYGACAKEGLPVALFRRFARLLVGGVETLVRGQFLDDLLHVNHVCGQCHSIQPL